MRAALLCLALVAGSGCLRPYVRIVAAGDVHLGPHGGDVLAPIAHHLVGDVRFANLEGPLVAGCTPTREQLCGEVERAGTLRRRFDVVSLVNNHADDFGQAGHASTRRALATVGVVAAEGRTELRRRGQRITVLLRSLAPGEPIPQDLIDEVRRTGDIVLVSLHWGDTGVLWPTADARAGAHTLIEAGAIAVLGHGPHTVQPVELYRNGVIAYSLGNLAFDCECSTEKDAFVLSFSISPRRRVADVRLHPIRAAIGATATADAFDDRELGELLRRISKEVGMRLEVSNGAFVVSPARGD